jgi:hypothetical protein
MAIMRLLTQFKHVSKEDQDDLLQKYPRMTKISTTPHQDDVLLIHDIRDEDTVITTVKSYKGSRVIMQVSHIKKADQPHVVSSLKKLFKFKKRIYVLYARHRQCVFN